MVLVTVLLPNTVCAEASRTAASSGVAALTLPNGMCSSEAGAEAAVLLVWHLAENFQVSSSHDSPPVQPYRSLIISKIPKSYYFCGKQNSFLHSP